MKGLVLIVRALVVWPVKRRPMRVVLPMVGMAIGIAAVAAIPSRQLERHRVVPRCGGPLSGHSDFVIIEVAGVPLEHYRDRSRLTI